MCVYRSRSNFSFSLIIFMIFVSLLNSFVSVSTEDRNILYIYHGNGYIVTRNGSILVCNGESVDEAVVVVKLEAVDQGLAKVVVEINGIKNQVVDYISRVILRCSGEDIYSLLRNCKPPSGAVSSIPLGSFSLSLTFSVNISNNYAWLDKEFIGFFPLYVFPDVRYENATNIRAVYLDDELKLYTLHGKPMIARWNISNIIFRSIEFYNKYIRMSLIHHYPVYLTVLLPIGNNTYLLLSLTPDSSMYSRILAVNDYPEGVTYIDYTVLGLMITIGGVIAVAIYFGVKSLRKRR